MAVAAAPCRGSASMGTFNAAEELTFCSAPLRCSSGHMHQPTRGLCVQGLGYALSLLGFFWYNYIKMQPAPAPAYTAVPTRDTDGAAKP